MQELESANKVCPAYLSHDPDGFTYILFKNAYWNGRSRLLHTFQSS